MDQAHLEERLETAERRFTQQKESWQAYADKLAEVEERYDQLRQRYDAKPESAEHRKQGGGVRHAKGVIRTSCVLVVDEDRVLEAWYDANDPDSPEHFEEFCTGFIEGLLKEIGTPLRNGVWWIEQEAP